MVGVRGREPDGGAAGRAGGTDNGQLARHRPGGGAGAGAAVVVSAREPGALQVVSEEVAAIGVGALAVPADVGRREEVAAVLYLASEAAGFTTGAVLNVNGGSWMG